MSEFMIALTGEYPAHLESWLKDKATEAIKQAVASEIESSDPWPWAKKPYEQFYAVDVRTYPHHPAGKTDLSLRIDAMPWDERDQDDGCGGCMVPARRRVDTYHEYCEAHKQRRWEAAGGDRMFTAFGGMDGNTMAAILNKFMDTLGGNPKKGDVQLATFNLRGGQ